MRFYISDLVLHYRGHEVSALSLYSYLLDWLIYISILLIFMLYGTVIPPRYHEFLTHDISLMNSYKAEDETVIPINLLIWIAAGFPVFQFLACSIFSGRTLSKPRQLWDIFIGLTCLCGAMGTQLMITCILKNICGLPRPDMLSRCEPVEGTDEDDIHLSTVDICANINTHILREGFRSFPSGHLSTVFCGMVVSSLNIAAKLQVLDQRGISFKILIAIIPIMVAWIVSCSRISDHRHFLRDVLGGFLIGTSVAIWFYTQYFPSIFDLENCGRAYPPRRIGIANFFNNVGGFWKINDTLSGSYNERNLNSSDAIRKLQLLEGDLNTVINLNNMDQLAEIPENITFFNNVSKKLGRKYYNLKSHTSPILPVYDPPLND
ncbi:uncharacterized protein PRCAT00003194001 [Priceomyces carsonii]|uniref:uncharacterized protein n=1 Tax=Priceomyces carsonii TaxID=28549 RepID=UPI002ED7B8DF|nr:unnamed protein product [Priceomyces carsonii]